MHRFLTSSRSTSWLGRLTSCARTLRMRFFSAPAWVPENKRKGLHEAHKMRTRRWKRWQLWERKKRKKKKKKNFCLGRKTFCSLKTKWHRLLSYDVNAGHFVRCNSPVWKSASAVLFKKKRTYLSEMYSIIKGDVINKNNGSTTYVSPWPVSHLSVRSPAFVLIQLPLQSLFLFLQPLLDFPLLGCCVNRFGCTKDGGGPAAGTWRCSW